MSKVLLTLLVISLALYPPQIAFGQPGLLGFPGYSVDTWYSQPANVGWYMFVAVNVTNRSYYIVASVDKVELTFDWGAILTGGTPRLLQPGENNTWRFEPIEIPSSTWSGKHVCLIDVLVTFAYPTWRLGRILTYQNVSQAGEVPIQFELQSSIISDATTTREGPKLLRTVSNVTASLNQAGMSLISLAYRFAMVGFVVAAVLLLTIRSYLQGRRSKTESTRLEQENRERSSFSGSPRAGWSTP